MPISISKLNTNCNAKRSQFVPLNVYYQNVTGLRTKLKEFFLNVQCNDEVDVFLLTETWLYDGIQNLEVFPSDYQLFRSDNNQALSNKDWGGGVLIAIKNFYTVLREPICYNTKLTDAIFIHVAYFNVKLLLGCVYISPGSPLVEYLNFYKFCASILDIIDPFFRILICGDFNLPKLYGVMSNELDCSTEISVFFDFINEHSLAQYNSILNKLGRYLDLVISNEHISISHCSDSLVKEHEHHPALSFQLNLPNARKRNVSFEVSRTGNYNFSKANPNILCNEMLNINFDILYDVNDADIASNCFNNLLYSAFDKCVPRINNNTSKRYPIYYTKKIIDRLKQKAKYHKKMKFDSNRSHEFHLKYRRLRLITKSEIKKAYRRYAEKCEDVIINDPKKIWTFTSDKLDKKKFMPDSLIFDNETYTKPTLVAEKFAGMFQSIYVNDVNSDFDIGNFVGDYISNRSTLYMVTEVEVMSALNKLKPSTSLGPDLIPSFILKGFAWLLVRPLCHIFNLCIANAVYPNNWKVSRVCPIFKKGDRNRGENYRAISVLSSCSKCFELIIYNRLLSQVTNYITPSQHGFMRGRSTVTNLTTFTNIVAECLNNKMQMDTIYFDFRAAFDRVNHSLLLKKLLDKFDLPPYLLHLIMSYLSNRFQYVTFKGASSNLFPVMSGVPQGSILGPLLFNIFINDLPEVINSANVLLYADDLKIFKAIQTEDDCHDLQSDIDNIMEWCLFNKMTLHSSKCEVMRYCRSKNKILNNYLLDGCVLRSNGRIKDLGVYFTDCLSFLVHITETVKAANRILGFVIRVCYHFRNTSTFKLLFNSLVRSKLEYASVVWSPSAQSHSLIIEKCQKRFLRYMYFRRHGIYPHYLRHPVRTEAMLNEFEMLSLERRRIVTDCMFIFKVLSNIVDCQFILSNISFRVNCKNTRNKDLLLLTGCNDSPLRRASNNFNNGKFDFDPFVITSHCLLNYLVKELS